VNHYQILKSKLCDILKRSEELLHTEKEQSEKLVGHSSSKAQEWWSRRELLDKELNGFLNDLQETCFGCWKGLFLGSFSDDLIDTKLREWNLKFKLIVQVQIRNLFGDDQGICDIDLELLYICFISIDHLTSVQFCDCIEVFEVCIFKS